MEEEVAISKNAQDTKKIGKEFIQKLKPGQIIFLTGDLGAGKTTFVQGAAAGLNIPQRIISPTFILVRAHSGVLKDLPIKMYHVDLYRVENDDEIKSLGLEEMFDGKNNLIFIEWGKKTNKIKHDWEVDFKILDDNEREIKIIKNE